MTDASNFLNDKILQVERDYRQSLLRAKEYKIKSEEASRRAEECQILLKHLKEWHNLEDGQINKLPASSILPSDLGGVDAVPIRQLVGICLERMETFSTSKLVDAVQQLNPNAKSNSIQGDLSRRKADNDVTQIATGLYQSNLFKKSVQQTEEPNESTDGEESDDDGLTDPFADDDDKPVYKSYSRPTPAINYDDNDGLSDPFAE